MSTTSDRTLVAFSTSGELKLSGEACDFIRAKLPENPKHRTFADNQLLQHLPSPEQADRYHPVLIKAIKNLGVKAGESLALAEVPSRFTNADCVDIEMDDADEDDEKAKRSGEKVVLNHDRLLAEMIEDADEDSMDPDEMREFIRDLKRAAACTGDSTINILGPWGGSAKRKTDAEEKRSEEKKTKT
jgi:hypothetical protein